MFVAQGVRITSCCIIVANDMPRIAYTSPNKFLNNIASNMLRIKLTTPPIKHLYLSSHHIPSAALYVPRIAS